MKRLIVLPSLLCLGAAVAAPADAFETWKAYEPPALTCGSGLIGLTLGDSNRCLQVSGNAVENIGVDTQSGLIYDYAATGRAAIIADDASGLAAVFGVRASHSPWVSYSSAGVLEPDGQHLDLTEAFGTFGKSPLRVRAGLLDATFDTLADKADDFDWLADLGPFQSHYGVTSIALGGIGVQVTSDLPNGISTGAGIEDIGGIGTAIGYIGFGQGDTRAKITAVVGGMLDGKADAWSLSGYAQTKLGVIDLLTTAYADDAGARQATLSGKLSLGQVFVAADGVYGDDGYELGASAHVGDPDLGPSVGIAGRMLDSKQYSLWQAEARASILAAESVKLLARAGVTEAVFPSMPNTSKGLVEYLAAGAIWQPTDPLQISGTYSTNSLGGWSTVMKAEERF